MTITFTRTTKAFSSLVAFVMLNGNLFMISITTGYFGCRCSYFFYESGSVTSLITVGITLRAVVITILIATSPLLTSRTLHSKECATFLTTKLTF